MSSVFTVEVPLINVNDDDARLSKWSVDHGAAVSAGDILCSLETSKASFDVESEHDGVLYRAAEEGIDVKVGSIIAYIGPDMAAIESQLSGQRSEQNERTANEPIAATRRARALAEENGVELRDILAIGLTGTIKETDVQRFLAQRSSQAPAAIPTEDEQLPQSVLERLEMERQLSQHERFVAQTLRASVDGLVLATLEREVSLRAVHAEIRPFQSEGTLVSPVHAVVHALGHTLKDFPRLTYYHHAGKVYRYKSMDVAIVVRDAEGQLFTPVIREVDKLSLKDVARVCQGLAMRVMRGKIGADELAGACFTVSFVAIPKVSRFTALPNRYQSAILAMSSQQERLVLDEDGKVTKDAYTSLTLSYDHVLADATYAAEFLGALAKRLEG